jgi:hypothetical protein
MRTAAAWPPKASDHEGLVRTYEAVLGWHLLVGGCAVESAHEAVQELAGTENTMLHTAGSGFDAVSVPRPAGMDTMLRLGRCKLGLVPSLITTEWVTLLVKAGTGSAFHDLPAVEVVSGAESWLALPPSPGVRWDTPPWSASSPTPLDLVDGALVRAPVQDGLRLYGCPSVLDARTSPNTVAKCHSSPASRNVYGWRTRR